MESQSHQIIKEPITGPCLSSEEDFLAQYTTKKAIGHGGFAQVNLAHHKLTGIPVAIKVLNKEEQPHHQIRSEVEVMRRIQHPNIVTLLQVIETDQKVYLAMELVEGQLLYWLVLKFGYLKEYVARSIFYQLLSALCYCHEQGIAHQDIKPDNIMVTFKGRVKLLDFGLSTMFIPGQMHKCGYGPNEYNPPEIYTEELCDASKVDAWKLGIILYFIVTGTVPFKSDSIDEIQKQVRKGIYNFPDHLSEALRSLIRKMLTVNPQQRPMLKIIKGHPWLARASTRSPYEDPMSRVPDPKIMAAMASIGIRTEDVKDALLHQKYNETLAIYKIFQVKARRRKSISVITEPVAPGSTPCPSPSDPATFPLTLKRTVSMPRLQSSSSEYSHQKRMKNVRTLPCKRRILNTAPQSPLSAPCTSMAHSHKGDSENPMLTERTVKEDSPLCTEALPMPSAASWRRLSSGNTWARRFWNTLLKLCCCMPCKKEEKEDTLKEETPPNNEESCCIEDVEL